jgi:hypothetical protein
MSSKFFNDVEKIYTSGGNCGVTTRRRFQCSPAMATCDGLYDVREYQLNQLPLTPKPVKQEKEETARVDDEDKDIETFLRDREIKKMQDGAIAMKNIMNGHASNPSDTKGMGAARCDMTGEECMIVCEELWIDFKKWMNRDENISQSFMKIKKFIVQYYVNILCISMFFIWFRWYVGGGKNACSEGFGVGLVSFMCEVARTLGEVFLGIWLGIGGFCAGLLPLLLGVCIYEIKNMKKTRDEDDSDDDDDDGSDDDGSDDDENTEN